MKPHPQAHAPLKLLKNTLFYFQSHLSSRDIWFPTNKLGIIIPVIDIKKKKKNAKGRLNQSNLPPPKAFHI